MAYNPYNNFKQTVGDNDGKSCPMPLKTSVLVDPEEEDDTIMFSEPVIEGDNIVYEMHMTRPSAVWCTNPVKLRYPLEWCHPCGGHRFAFVAVLYPDAKGKLSYLDGALGVALGLRKQCARADIVCLVTSDVTQEDICRLEVVFDEVIVVPYITSSDTLIENQWAIEISPEIYQGCWWYDGPDAPTGCKHPYCSVFTKIHTLRMTQYDKVVLVDLDIIPIENYDSLFGIEAPAGIIEYPRFKDFSLKTGCKLGLSLGDLIPHELTDIDKETGSDINAGLLVIKPDIEEYEDIIAELKKPRKEWFDKKGLRAQKFNPGGKKEWEYSYCFPEQSYLTKKWSGTWRYVDWAFGSWQVDSKLSFGVHFAGWFFQGKPWSQQAVGYLMYDQKNKNKIIDVYESFAAYDRAYLWGLENYPALRYILLRDLVFVGAYRRSVNETCGTVTLAAQYPKLTKKEKLYWYELKEGRGNDAIRDLLAPEQRMIVDLLIE